MSGALILIVEDNEANQLLARAVLEMAGYRVDVAGAAPDALKRLSEPVSLSSFRGHVTSQLKANPKTAGIPIVALTAHAMKGDREDALAAGCAGYIAKPIDTRTFGETVRQFIPPG